MQNSLRLRRVSTLMSWAALVVLLLSIGLAVAALLSPSLRQTYLAGFDFVDPAAPVGAVQLLLVTLFGAVVLLVGGTALWQMHRLFRRYARGETLSEGAARNLQRMGQAMLALAVLSLVQPTLFSLVLTQSYGVGQRSLVVAVSSGDIGFLLGGGLLLVVGWVLSDAARIARENEGFV